MYREGFKLQEWRLVELVTVVLHMMHGVTFAITGGRHIAEVIADIALLVPNRWGRSVGQC